MTWEQDTAPSEIKKKKQVWKILSESDNLEDGSATRWWQF